MLESEALKSEPKSVQFSRLSAHSYLHNVPKLGKTFGVCVGGGGCSTKTCQGAIAQDPRLEGYLCRHLYSPVGKSQEQSTYKYNILKTRNQ